ncbi:MAG: phosphotransferase [bacterium]|nr:phosphotransferase [bacterium]MCP5071106.1 phosphotransferase [bacterium]
MRKQLCLSDENLPDYLVHLGLFGPDEDLQVEIAGDGNINWVRRASLPGGTSYIVKQARPALEKFPEYEVTTERLIFEARYLERVQPFDTDGICPKVIGFDPDERVLVLEDLSDCTRLDDALTEGLKSAASLQTLARFLARVHAATAKECGLAAAFENDAMRRLHGDHIFILPYLEEFPAPPATTMRAAELRADRELAGIAREAYDTYLRPNGPLVHADVQATNILLGANGPKLIDAEIAHAGDPAFDIGTLIAHLVLPDAARGEPERAIPLTRAVWQAYRNECGPDATPLEADVIRYAGLELIRRTIGAARVRYVKEDEAGLRVLDLGTDWTRGPGQTASSVLGYEEERA